MSSNCFLNFNDALTYPASAIIKSITFHPCLKYENLCTMKPIPIIFNIASIIKTIESTVSILSKTLFL